MCEGPIAQACASGAPRVRTCPPEPSPPPRHRPAKSERLGTTVVGKPHPYLLTPHFSTLPWNIIHSLYWQADF